MINNVHVVNPRVYNRALMSKNKLHQTTSLERATYFICLHRGTVDQSISSLLFKVNGGSTSIAVGVRSFVDLNLMTNACPPILLADPGSIKADVTPPAIDKWNPSSCVFNASRERNQG